MAIAVANRRSQKKMLDPRKDSPMETTHERSDGLAKDAADWIRKLILSGELRGGELISENILVERYAKEKNGSSLSRTPIRQALVKLSGECLVDILPRFGTQVRLVHAEDAVNIMGLRYAIETVVVCHLSRIHASVDFTPVEMTTKAMEILAKLGKPLTTEEKTRFVQADIAFHSELAGLAGYSVAIEPLRMFSGQYLLAAILSIQNPTAREAVLKEHLAILKAIRSGNEEEAREAMHRHLSATLDRWSPYSSASTYLREEVPSFFGLKPLKPDSESSRPAKGGSHRKDTRPIR